MPASKISTHDCSKLTSTLLGTKKISNCSCSNVRKRSDHTFTLEPITLRFLLLFNYVIYYFNLCSMCLPPVDDIGQICFVLVELATLAYQGSKTIYSYKPRKKTSWSCKNNRVFKAGNSINLYSNWILFWFFQLTKHLTLAHACAELFRSQ